MTKIIVKMIRFRYVSNTFWAEVGEDRSKLVSWLRRVAEVVRSATVPVARLARVA